MTSQQLTALVIKILAIWLLVNVVLYLPSIAMLTTSFSKFNETAIPTSFSVLIFSAFLVVGFLVAFIMLRVSNSVLNNVQESASPYSISPDLVLQVVGLFFIVSALSILPGQILVIAKQVSIQPPTYGYLAGELFKLFVGLYLFVKTAGWHTWLNKLRGGRNAL